MIVRTTPIRLYHHSSFAKLGYVSHHTMFSIAIYAHILATAAHHPLPLTAPAALNLLVLNLEHIFGMP